MSENLEKIRPALVALEVGESVSFPISRLKSVRTQASELGLVFPVSPGLELTVVNGTKLVASFVYSLTYMHVFYVIIHAIPSINTS